MPGHCGGLRALFPGAECSPFPWPSRFNILPVFGVRVSLAEGGWFLSSPVHWDGPIAVLMLRTVLCKVVLGQRVLLGTSRASPCPSTLCLPLLAEELREHLVKLWCQARL